MFPRSLLTSSAFLLSLLAAHAQSRTLQSVRGQVVAAGRATAAGIEVVIEKIPNRLVGRTETDGSGNFEFRNLDAGQYEVIVRLQGYQESEQTVTIENPAMTIDPAEGTEPAEQRLVADVGIIDQSNLYFVLVRTGSDSAASDPEMVALSRKYPRRIIQAYEKVQEENRKGNTQKAMERLETLLKEAPDFFTGHNDLGAMYQRTNRFRDAEREYKSARVLNQQSALPLVNLGGLYLQEADSKLETDPDLVGDILDNALDALEEAVKLEPHAAQAYYLLGTAYYKSAFYEEAETNLLQALSIQPGLAAARLTLINTFLRQNKWQSALENLDSYATDFPNAANREQLLSIRSKVSQTIQEAGK